MPHECIACHRFLMVLFLFASIFRYRYSQPLWENSDIIEYCQQMPQFTIFQTKYAILNAWSITIKPI